jgi:hypothetical protein
MANDNADQLWVCSKGEDFIDVGEQCDKSKISETQSLDLVKQNKSNQIPHK